MLANDFVGLTTLVQEFCNKWKLKYNIKKSAVTVFFKHVKTDWYMYIKVGR